MNQAEMVGVLFTMAEAQGKQNEKLLTALEKQIAALGQATAAVNRSAGDVQTAALSTVPAVQKAVEGSVASAVAQSMTGASQAAAKAMEASATPVLGHLSLLVHAATGAEDKLNGAVAAFRWKWIAVAGAATAAAVATAALITWGTVWWWRGEIEALQTQHQELTTHVAKLQAQADELVRRGVKLKPVK